MPTSWLCALRPRRRAVVAVAASLGVVLAVGVAVAAAPPQYKLLKKITLGGDGGWDYLTADPAHHRLFISRATRVMVVDTQTEKVLSEIPDTPGVHGIALAPDLGKGFISNGRDNSVSIFDLETLKVTGKVKTGENPDAILYEPTTHRVIAFNGRSRDATVIDAKTGTVAGTVALGGKPEAGVFDGHGQVFVNVEDKGEIVAFDPQSLEVKAHWPLAPCQAPTGLAFDAKKGRLFAACGSRHMAVVDAKTGKVLATVPIGAGADGAAFDPDSHLAFSSNGEGTLTVVGEKGDGTFEVVDTVKTERGARTLTLDAKNHVLYLVTAEFAPPPSPTPDGPRGRPPLVPGTFAVLAIGR